MSNQSLNQPFLLIGEGKGEQEFFADLLGEMGVSGVQTEAYQGKDKLKDYLKGLRVRSGFDKLERIGITRDADDDPAAAEASVEAAIAAAGLPEKLIVRKLIIPGNDRPGALETMWLDSLSGDSYGECVRGFFACLEEKGWEPSQQFSKKDKAHAQVWLATKNPSNEAFHRASAYGRRPRYSGERWVDFSHEAFTPLKNFIRECFHAA